MYINLHRIDCCFNPSRYLCNKVQHCMFWFADQFQTVDLTSAGAVARFTAWSIATPPLIKPHSRRSLIIASVGETPILDNIPYSTAYSMNGLIF